MVGGSLVGCVNGDKAIQGKKASHYSLTSCSYTPTVRVVLKRGIYRKWWLTCAPHRRGYEAKELLNNRSLHALIHLQCEWFQKVAWMENGGSLLRRFEVDTRPKSLNNRSPTVRVVS